MIDKDYIVIVQCHIVMERCSGYFCEKAFHKRTGGFASLPADRPVRAIHLTCGGCCGLAVHRKMGDLLRMIEKKEGIGRDRIGVQLASCITKHNYHGPPCPHLDYLKALLADKLGLDVAEDTHVSETSERRRRKGLYPN